LRLQSVEGMRFTRLCWSLVVALGLGACNEKEEPNPYGGVSLAEAPQQIAKAVCPRAYECCTQNQLMNNDLAGTDPASCEAKTTEGFRNNLQTVANSQKAGRSVYRGDKLAACLDYIRNSSCQELNRTNHFTGLQCEPYTEPRVAPGGKCTLDFECIGGFCEKPAGEGAIEGTCKMGDPPPPTTRGQAPAGQMCFYASSCAYGGGHGRPAGGGLALVLTASLLGACVRRRRRR
jgi:hypothetical protein